MKKLPHLLRVTEAPELYAPLIASARSLALRVGWLELGASPDPLPASLARAAELGVLRAVAAGQARVATVKPLSGPAVLADLLREHFRGCALVLVNGQIEAPLLTADGEQWRVDPPGRLLTADQLAAALRRPRPWE